MKDYKKMFKPIQERTSQTGLPREDWFLLQELLDKATPMKPVECRCPNDGCHIDKYKPILDYEVKYCSDCGQALDWNKDA